MLVVGFDCETTGLNTSTDFITEVGAVLWDTARKTPLYIYSQMLKVPSKLDPRITELTGIKDEDLSTYGAEPYLSLKYLNAVFEKAEAIVAHNGNLFDRPIYEENCKRAGVTPVSKLWIDTSCDIDYPPSITTRRLVHLAAEHKFLNPFAHRAVFDVLTMLKVTENYDWENQIIKWAKSPTVTVGVKLDFNQVKEREALKKLNYRWNNESKIWTKSIKSFQLDEEKKLAQATGCTIKTMGGSSQ